MIPRHIFFIIALIILPCSLFSQTLEEILEKHEKASGFEKLKKIKKAHIKTRFKDNGALTESEYYIIRSGKMWLRNFSDEESIIIINGTLGWIQQGGTVIKSDKENMGYYNNDLYNLAGIQKFYISREQIAELEYKGMTVFRGDSAHRIDMPESASFFLDPKTYLIIGVRPFDNGGIEYIVYSYRNIDGIQIPMKTIAKDDDYTVFSSEYMLVDLNPEISDSLFNEPEKPKKEFSPELLEIMDKCLKASGAEHFDEVKTIYASLNVKNIVNKYRCVYRYVKPNRMRKDHNTFGRNVVSVMDGDECWSTVDGRLTQISEEEKKNIIADMNKELWTSNVFEDYYTNDLNYKLEGMEEVYGRDAYKVRVYNFQDTYVFIDAETYLKTKAIRNEGVLETHIYYNDYRNIDGILIPFNMKNYIKESASIVGNLVYDSIKFNVKFEDSLFERPAGDELSLVEAYTGIDMDIDSLIKLNLEASGAESIKNIKTLHIISEVSVGPMNIDVEYFLSMPDKIWKKSNMFGKENISVINGDEAWSQIDGKLQAISHNDSAMMISDIKKYAGVKDIYLDCRDKIKKYKILSVENFNGIDAYKVSSNADIKNPNYKYISTESFLVIGSRDYFDQSGYMDSQFSNFKQVHGIMVPHTMKMQMNGQITGVINHNTLEINIDIDESLFESPE